MLLLSCFVKVRYLSYGFKSTLCPKSNPIHTSFTNCAPFPLHFHSISISIWISTPLKGSRDWCVYGAGRECPLSTGRVWCVHGAGREGPRGSRRGGGRGGRVGGQRSRPVSRSIADHFLGVPVSSACHGPVVPTGPASSARPATEPNTTRLLMTYRRTGTHGRAGTHTLELSDAGDSHPGAHGRAGNSRPGTYRDSV